MSVFIIIISVIKGKAKTLYTYIYFQSMQVAVFHRQLWTVPPPSGHFLQAGKPSQYVTSHQSLDIVKWPCSLVTLLS